LQLYLTSPTFRLLDHLQGYNLILYEGPHIFITITANEIYTDAAQNNKIAQ
jgi:hypothetical protein